MPAQKSTASKSKFAANDPDKQEWGACCRDRHQSFWGVALVVVGFVWLAKSLGWLDEVDLPVLPLALILLGVYFLVRSSGHSSRKHSSS